MKRIAFIFTLVFYLLKLDAQVQVLKSYNFEEGGYYLLGARAESDRNSFADSLGVFYTNDIQVLNKIKKEWVFKKPSPKYACGYHYYVLICKDGKELESFAVNLNCNEIVSDKGYFYFDTNKLRKFKNDFKKPYEKYNTFKSLEEARVHLENIKKDTNVIVYFSPDWEKYDGNFSFEYSCAKKSNPCGEYPHKTLLKKLENEIRTAYPGEDFKIDWKGGSLKEVDIEVTCKLSLLNKFKLYPIIYEWKSFYPQLATYWKVKQR